MNLQYTEYHVQDRIATIVLNRPDKRNAFNHALVSELKTLINQAIQNTQVKIIRIKANGEVFSAGADLDYLKQLQQNTFEENLADSNHLKELFEQLYYCPKLTIAQVEGHAIAGGCGLATVCDFTFATPSAKFGYTEVKIGFIPAIVSIFLLKKINGQQAKELLFTGKLIAAEEAKKMSLITDVIDAADINQHVIQFAQKCIAEVSADAIALTKKLMQQTETLNTHQAFSLAAEYNAKARGTDDCKKGIAAFLNKESIVW